MPNFPRVLAALLFCAIALPLGAQTLTWTGAANNSTFGLAGNWSPEIAPGPANDCIIPPGSGGILVSAPVTVKSLSVGRPLTLGSCASLSLVGDLALTDNALFIIESGQSCSMLTFGPGAHAVTGSGDIHIRTSGTTGRAIFAQAGAAVTFQPGITVRLDAASTINSATIYADTGATITNKGVFASRSGGKVLTVTGPGTFTNEGSLDADGGKIVMQPGFWSNSGTIAIDASGEFNAAGAYAALGPVERTAGTLRLSGNFSGATLEATPATGTILLSNFTATSTTLLASDPDVAPIVLDSGVILNNCTIGTNLSMQNCAAISVSSGLTFINNATLTVDPGTNCIVYPLSFDGGTQSISGTGTIAFKRYGYLGDGRALTLRNNVTLTIEPGISLVSSSDTPSTSSRIQVEAGSTLINKGLIGANVAGLTIFISGAGSLQNLGTLEALAGKLVIDVSNWTNANTLHLAGTGSIVLGGSFPSIGTVVRTGGTLALSGVYGANTLEASDATGDLTLNGPLTGVSLKTSGTSRFLVARPDFGTFIPSLNACTLEGNLEVVGEGSLTITGGLTFINSATIRLRATQYNKVTQILFSGPAQTLSGPGEILFADRAGTAQIGVDLNSVATIGPEISVRDLDSATGAQNTKVALDQTSTLTIQGSFEASQPDRTLQFLGGTIINEGSLFASAGTLELWANWTNNGFISLATGATLSLGGTYSDFGFIDRTGGTVNLIGTFTGTSLSTADLAGDIGLADVTLTNATLQTAGNARFLVRGNPTLDACTLAGTLVVGDCSQPRIKNGLTLDAATILFAPTGPCSPASSYIYFENGPPQTLGGTGNILLDRGLLYVSNNATFGPGISISIGAPGASTAGSILVYTGNTLTNHSTITANAPGSTLNINGNGSFINLGTLRALAGTLDVRCLLGGLGNIDLTPSARLVLGGSYTIDSDLAITSGGQLEFYGNWTNNAVISSDHGTVYLGGTWSNAGTFNISNSNWNIGGVYPSLGNYTSTSNTLSLSGTFPGTSIVADASTGDITLSNITFNNANFSTSGGATFKFGGGVNLNSCSFSSDISLSPCAGTVITGGLTLNNVSVTVNLNCKADALAFSGPSQTLGGTGSVRIKADLNGNAINARNAPGASLTIGPGITVSFDADATETAASINIETGSLINQGVLEVLRPGATLTIGGAGTFINQGHLAIATGSLNIAKLSGPLGSFALAPGAGLTLAGTYSLTDNLSISDGATLTLNGAWTNTAAISINNANLILGGTWTNSGSFAVNNSNWTIGGTYPSLGNHSFSNTSLTYAGTFPGTSLVANAHTGTINLGTLTLSSATLSTADGASFAFTNNALVTLKGCTIASDITVGPCAAVVVQNGLTLANNAAVRISNSACSSQPFQVSGGTQLIEGVGRILYDHAKSLSLLYISPGTSATIGPEVFLGFDPDSTETSSAAITRFTTLINQGTIAARAPGRTLSINTGGTFNNQGVVESTAGTLAISSVSIANYTAATKTLTGGFWRALNGSLTIQSTPINAIGPNTEFAIRGQSISTPNIAGLTSNAGTLRLADRSLTLPSLSNSGTLDLGAGALLTLTGAFTSQPASTLRVEIAGLAPDQFGRIAAAQSASLTGSLRGSFSAPYIPLPGDVASSFVAAPTITGSFDSVCFDSNPFLLGVLPLALPDRIDLLVSASSGFSPTITQQPGDSSSPRTAVLSVVAGPSDASFQWRMGETPLTNGPTGTGSTISGATTDTLVITGLSGADTGEYSVMISSACSTITSDAANVRLCPGDLNNDAMVDDADFTIFVGAYNILDCADPGMPAGCPSDLNGDTVVDDADFTEFVLAYNALLCP